MNDDLLRPRALYEGVAVSLRERLFAHEFEPGEALDESALARGYGVSRTPVREALKVLAREGLLSIEPRRGCCVAELEDSDVHNLLDVLELLELHALREATHLRCPLEGASDHASLFARLGNRYAAEATHRLNDKLLLTFGPDYDHDNTAALTRRLGTLGTAMAASQVDRVEAVWRDYMQERRRLANCTQPERNTVIAG